MQTLTATEARRNLTRWLKAARDGQEVGIVYGSDIIALRPVPIEAADYAQQEYGVSPRELAAFARRMDSEIEKDRSRGGVRAFAGKLPKRHAG